MFQWFIRFPELAEFTEFPSHLEKTPLGVLNINCVIRFTYIMFFAVDVKLTWAICSHVAIKAGASVRIVSIRTRSIHARVLVTIIAFWNINLRNMFHISENYSLWHLVLGYICFVRY